MRFWDEPDAYDPPELVHNFERSGGEYFQYKIDTVPHMFDYVPGSQID